MRRNPVPARARLLAAMAAAGLAASVAPAVPVDALEQGDGLRVGYGETVEAEYPPIPLMFPANPPEDLGRKPDDCRKAAYCDVIPFEVVLPDDFSPADEFFMEVTLNWETEKLEEGPTLPEVGPAYPETAVNDLDMFLWDVPAGETFHASGATDQVPEVMRVFTPTKGRYEIIVINFSGPNTGYTLTATYKPEAIDRPFELLEPVFELPPPVDFPPPAPVVDNSGEAPFELAPEPAPAVSVPVAAPAPVLRPPVAKPTPKPKPLTPVDVAPDKDFSGFSDEAFDDELAAPPETTVLGERQVTAVSPAPPASAARLVMWLLVLPLAVAASAGGWLLRRQRVFRVVR